MSAEEGLKFPFGEGDWHDDEPADAEVVEQLESLMKRALAEVPLVDEQSYTIGNPDVGGVIIGTSKPVSGAEQLTLRVCGRGSTDPEDAIFSICFSANGQPTDTTSIVGSSREELLYTQMLVESVSSCLLQCDNLLPDETSLLRLLPDITSEYIHGIELDADNCDPCVMRSIKPLVEVRAQGTTVLTQKFNAEVENTGEVTVHNNTETNSTEIVNSARYIMLTREEGGGLVYYHELGSPAVLKSYDEDGNETVLGPLTASAAAELIPAIQEAIFDTWHASGVWDKSLEFPQAFEKLTDAFSGYKALARECTPGEEARLLDKAHETLKCIQVRFEMFAHVVCQPYGFGNLGNKAHWEQVLESAPSTESERRIWLEHHHNAQRNLLAVHTKHLAVFDDFQPDMIVDVRHAGTRTTIPYPVIPYSSQETELVHFMYEDLGTFEQIIDGKPVDRFIALGYLVNTGRYNELPPTFKAGFIYVDLPEDSSTNVGSFN